MFVEHRDCIRLTIMSEALSVVSSIAINTAWKVHLQTLQGSCILPHNFSGFCTDGDSDARKGQQQEFTVWWPAGDRLKSETRIFSDKRTSPIWALRQMPKSANHRRIHWPRTRVRGGSAERRVLSDNESLQWCRQKTSIPSAADSSVQWTLTLLFSKTQESEPKDKRLRKQMSLWARCNNSPFFCAIWGKKLLGTNCRPTLRTKFFTGRFPPQTPHTSSSRTMPCFMLKSTSALSIAALEWKCHVFLQHSSPTKIFFCRSSSFNKCKVLGSPIPCQWTVQLSFEGHDKFWGKAVISNSSRNKLSKDLNSKRKADWCAKQTASQQQNRSFFDIKKFRWKISCCSCVRVVASSEQNWRCCTDFDTTCATHNWCVGSVKWKISKGTQHVVKSPGNLLLVQVITIHVGNKARCHLSLRVMLFQCKWNSHFWNSVRFSNVHVCQGFLKRKDCFTHLTE